jgi:hypothetical protein
MAHDRLEPSAGEEESVGKVHLRVSLEQVVEDSPKAPLQPSDFDILEVSQRTIRISL